MQNLELCKKDILTTSTELNTSVVDSYKGIIKKINEHKKSGEKRFLTVWTEIERKIDKTNKEIFKAVEDGFELSKSLAESNLYKINETTEKSNTDMKNEIVQNNDLINKNFNEVDSIVKDYKKKVEEIIKQEFKNFDNKFEALECKSEDSNSGLIKKLLAEQKQRLKKLDGKIEEIKKNINKQRI